MPSGKISFRLTAQSSTTRPAIFDEAGCCLHVESVTLNFLVGRFMKPSPILPFVGIMLGDGEAWTGRSYSEGHDGPPNRKNLPNQPEQIGQSAARPARGLSTPALTAPSTNSPAASRPTIPSLRTCAIEIRHDIHHCPFINGNHFHLTSKKISRLPAGLAKAVELDQVIGYGEVVLLR